MVVKVDFIRTDWPFRISSSGADWPKGNLWDSTMSVCFDHAFMNWSVASYLFLRLFIELSSGVNDSYENLI
jgi:hypothetical protein